MCLFQGVQQEQLFWFSHQPLSKTQTASINISSSQNRLEKKSHNLTCMSGRSVFIFSISTCAPKHNHRCKQLHYSPFISRDLQAKWSTAGMWCARRCKSDAGVPAPTPPQLQREQTGEAAALGHSKVKECALHRNQGSKTDREATEASPWILKKLKN